MLSNLKNPFPSNYGQKEKFYISLGVGVFVATFLLIFEPFGISESQEVNRFAKTLGFGGVSFFCLLIVYFVTPKLFPEFFLENNYTLGKELIMGVVTILIIGIGNAIFIYFFNESEHVNVFLMIWHTFLVGIFPLTFLSLIQYNKLLHSNLKISEEIQQHHLSKPLQKNLKSKSPFYISSDSEKSEVPIENLLFVESMGNYANVVQIKDGKLSRNLYRTTLKAIETQNEHTNVIRCHRSYIANLDQVKEVEGNAQGLKLYMHDCEDIVPVSRKYIPDVKHFFAQN